MSRYVATFKIGVVITFCSSDETRVGTAQGRSVRRVDDRMPGVAHQRYYLKLLFSARLEV